MSEKDRAAWDKVDDALRQLGDALDSAFTTIGDTLRDPELREQLKTTANTLADSITKTIHDVSDDVKSRFGSAGTTRKGD
jgi:hypothetical protein